jgi:ribosomal protein S18 acetylase RimI-like enzyme
MTAVSREGEVTGTRYEVTPLHDPQAIRRLIEHDRAYAAYAIAQLDPLLFDQNEWWLSSASGGAEALLVHSTSGLGAALFAIGDPEALDVALSLHPGPRFTFGSLRLEHRAVAERHYVLSRPQLMTRMSVNAETFLPVSGPAVRLGPAEVSDVNRIYSIEGGPTAYRAIHLEDGVYYGVYVGGRLVSIAGTHVVSRAEGIAVVGNVFTHPNFRGQGHAKLATSAVTADLLRDCPMVVLTVESKNAPALAIYTKLGYEAVCTLHETPMLRKDPLGAGAFVRRSLAAWRGRSEHKEVVVR